MSTLFVQIDKKSPNNPVRRAIELVARTLFDATIVDQLVDGQDVEADVVVVNKAEDALRALKETEKTTIVVMCYVREDLAAAQALAARYPDRISATDMIGKEPFTNLGEAIARKSKEAVQ